MREGGDGDERLARQVLGADLFSGIVANAEDAGRGVVDGRAGSPSCRERARAAAESACSHFVTTTRSARASDASGSRRRPCGQQSAARVGRGRVEEHDVEVAREGDVREAVVEEVKGHVGHQLFHAPGGGDAVPVGHDRDARESAGEDGRLVPGIPHRGDGARAVRDDDRAAARPAVAARENRRAGCSRARSSPASHRTKGVLPVPPAATISDREHGASRPVNPEEAAAIRGEPRATPRSRKARRAAPRRVTRAALRRGDSSAHGGSAAVRAAPAWPAKKARAHDWPSPGRVPPCPRGAGASASAADAHRFAAKTAPSAASSAERMFSVDGPTDDRRAGAQGLEDVVPALRRERAAEERRLGEGVRSGELADRVEKEDVGGLSGPAPSRRDRRTTGARPPPRGVPPRRSLPAAGAREREGPERAPPRGAGARRERAGSRSSATEPATRIGRPPARRAPAPGERRLGRRAGRT